MENTGEKSFIRIDLTQAQKERIKAETGRNADAIELTVHELEERITPRLSSNHNETLLLDDAD